MKDQIIISDWAGNKLFEGSCNDPEVFRVMELNKDTDGTHPDIEVNWVDENRSDNVYEFIDF